MTSSVLTILRSTKLDFYKNTWAVVYGRFETRENLFAARDVNANSYHGIGFGHLGAAPAQLVYRKNDIWNFSDEQVQELLKRKICDGISSLRENNRK